MKPDEFRFLYAVNLALRLKLWPRDVINDAQLGINHKRCWWLLTKWARRSYYEYGTTLDLGWWTPKGKTWAEETIAAEIKRLGGRLTTLLKLYAKSSWPWTDPTLAKELDKP